MVLGRIFSKIMIPLAIVILFFVAIFIFPFPTVGKTFLLVSELVPSFPIKPMGIVTRSPIIEEKLVSGGGQVYTAQGANLGGQGFSYTYVLEERVNNEVI